MGVERKDWADTAVLLRDLRKYFYWKQIFSIKNKTFFSKTNYPLQNRIYFFVILIFHFWLVLKDRILFWNKVVFFEKKNLFYHFETKYFLSKTKLTFQIPKENYFISIARIFKGGGVDFLLKRAKQGASEASVAYVGGFRGEAPEDIPFPWIWKPQIARKLRSWMLFFSLNFSNTLTSFMATFMAAFAATLLWRLTF